MSISRGELLFAVKFAHTLVFLVESAAISYILYSGITNRRDVWLGVAVALVLIETAVYLGNGLRCPMTKLARQLGDRTGDDFIADLFLPKWFVPLVPRICGALAFGGLALVAARLFI